MKRMLFEFTEEELIMIKAAVVNMKWEYKPGGDGFNRHQELQEKISDAIDLLTDEQ